MNVLSRGWVVALTLLAATGCVSKGKYNEAVAETRTTRAELERKTNELDSLALDLSFRRAEIAQLRAEMDRMSATGAVNGSRMSELQKRLGMLEAAQRAAEARAALYKDLSFRLKQQIDDGDLALVIRDGRMVLQLPNDVLFDTGQTELKPAGKKALEAVAGVMQSMPHRAFQVAGHTDNVPIKNHRFASNWELSSGRALGVVHFLIEKGVQPSILSAAGYGEIDPVGKNDSVDGRKKNRRTEITLQPNIDELVKVPAE